ncbi:MAG: septum formation initiator family protein [Alistipes sp.]
MAIKLGRRFWIVATIIIIVFTVFVVGRNLLHAFKIKQQVNALMREQEYYQQKIEQDSTLIKHLEYDEYLEQYARENYHMQMADEQVYIIDTDSNKVVK